MVELGVLKRANFGELGHPDCSMFKSLAKKRGNSYCAGLEQKSVTKVKKALRCKVAFLKRVAWQNK